MIFLYILCYIIIASINLAVIHHFKLTECNKKEDTESLNVFCFLVWPLVWVFGTCYGVYKGTMFIMSKIIK